MEKVRHDRLGFAIQLKFMQLRCRFPERHEEIETNAAQNAWSRNSMECVHSLKISHIDSLVTLPYSNVLNFCTGGMQANNLDDLRHNR